jgi:hypothetical protein
MAVRVCVRNQMNFAVTKLCCEHTLRQRAGEWLLAEGKRPVPPQVGV